MTMHETLNFIDALHRCIEHNVSNLGPWCWPTRELANYNLRLNRDAFPRDRRLKESFDKQVSIAARRHWIADAPCSAHCHARHLTLTAVGQEALRLMNEQGCGPHCEQHRDTRLNLERKVA